MMVISRYQHVVHMSRSLRSMYIAMNILYQKKKEMFLVTSPIRIIRCTTYTHTSFCIHRSSICYAGKEQFLRVHSKHPYAALFVTHFNSFTNSRDSLPFYSCVVVAIWHFSCWIIPFFSFRRAKMMNL